MVEKNNKTNKCEKKTFVSYLDDDGEKKDQWVILTNEVVAGIEFHFEENPDSIFIPWSRVLKIKRKGG
jgi:hypothetical protein